MEKSKHDHISILPDELNSISETLRRDFQTYLKPYGVKFPTEGSQKHLWLVYLKKFQGEQIHKDSVSSFVSEHLPAAGKDQQVRHLSADGWYVLNRGDKVPNVEAKVKPGWHLLVTTESPKPTYIYKALKRIGRVGAQDFEDLKAVYDFRCATCGSEEGKPHRFERDKKTVLHRGHMNPESRMTLENIIPQCEMCNAVYSDDFVFDDKGRTIAVASLRPVLKASKRLKEEILRRLSSSPEDHFAD
ncbi:MAG: hypothetical protein K8F59_15345 [Rhodobacteraceae bacterium]|nr:hypothetical protein [Paracoccaceae bacterium]